MKLNWKQKGNAWFTLVELTVVVTLLWILIYALYPKFAWWISKNRDVTRVAVTQQYLWYYESLKQSLKVYPYPGMPNSTTWLRTYATKVWNWDAGWKNWEHYVLFEFSWEDDSNWYVTPEKDWKTKEFQELLVQAWIIWAPGDIKKLYDWEKMLIFTSKTWKSTVACTKMYAETEQSQADWDWIPDAFEPNWADWHKNWSRIFVQWDMKLWSQINWWANVVWPASTKCMNDLPDVRSL